ncbi:docking protein 2 [Myripristis murdjan]|uniref:docking protein 2 n=1 Tax=Myripristis murdjan TaxID=586833 RepID=UPI001175DC2C|nr:docking protein 2-like [Myripristis murdjan]
MEEDIRKQGMVYLQQQRFGKKWKRVWCVLYRESSCSISRLEFFECKETGTLEKNDKTLRKQQEHKKVIRLADCIRVTEVEVDGCPRDTGPFLIETTEKIYVFAADRQQLDDWTHKLCEIAFPMSWAERGGKRASLHRGNRVDEDEGMEDNSLYSGRETVRDFRVCVRRTEASDRCRLKGVCVLRTDTEALLLLQPKSGEVVFSWPYRFLRRFGRDKSTFSFEAGRRCDSGEGSFEFDTKQGNVLFQAVEAAINLQRIAFPHRQTSGGGQDGPETPPPLSQSRSQQLPQPRGQLPQPPTQAEEAVYSMVKDAPSLQLLHPKDREKESCSPPLQQRHLQSRLEPPVDKALTGVKSLNLDTRGHPAPRKNQVKMISSCPLPHSGSDPDLSASPALNPRLSPKLSANANQTYSEITLPGAAPLPSQEPEYSLPFDTIAKSVISDILKSHQALGLEGAESGADPLYDSIDESQIRAVLQGRAAGASRETYRKADHIYDEPEGCAAPAGQKPSVLPSVYDDPTEMKGNAWRIMGTVADPKGHEYPYNPRVDDYAVPKKPQRAFPPQKITNKEEKEEEREEEEEEEEEEEGSPYDNVMVKTM